MLAATLIRGRGQAPGLEQQRARVGAAAAGVGLEQCAGLDAASETVHGVEHLRVGCGRVAGVGLGVADPQGPPRPGVAEELRRQVLGGTRSGLGMGVSMLVGDGGEDAQGTSAGQPHEAASGQIGGAALAAAVLQRGRGVEPCLPFRIRETGTAQTRVVDQVGPAHDQSDGEPQGLHRPWRVGGLEGVVEVCVVAVDLGCGCVRTGGEPVVEPLAVEDAHLLAVPGHPTPTLAAPAAEPGPSAAVPAP